MSAASSRAGRVPAIGCIVGTHAAEPSSPALRVAARVLTDQGLTAPPAGAGSRLVRHTTRPEKRGKEDTMNRWTGTGHLTKDPKFLETESGTAICTLRIAVKRAGKQGHDGYFDVKCFDAQAYGVRAVPQGRTRDRRRRPAAVRRVPDPGRQLRLPGLHRRRARRVPRQPQGLQRSGQRRGLPGPARHRRRGARGPPGRLTTIAGPRRTTGRGPDDFHGDRHDHHDHHPPRDRRPGSSPRSPASAGPRRAARAALPPRRRAAHGPGLRPPDPRCADLATRAIALGRRTDVYVGCAPRTRRHGGRDAVDARVRAVGRLRRRATPSPRCATSSRRRRS